MLSAVQLSDFDKLTSSPGVYLFLDEDDRPLYVGQSVNPLKRRDQHAKSKKWFPQVAREIAYPVADIDHRLVLETILFLKFRPTHNRWVKICKRKDGTLYETMWLNSGHRKKGKKK